jgi:hypothetical protein
LPLRHTRRLDGLGLGLWRGGLLCLWLLGLGSLLGSVAIAVSVTVTVASGAAVVLVLSEPPTIPTPSATTDAMSRVGQPNCFGFFGCS